MTKQYTIGIAALTLCLVLLGCGGDGGGGEPTVTQTVHDELQAELDAALAELMETEGERNTAQASVVRLNTELATARTSVTRLEGVIGDEDDEAAADGSLYAQLSAANAEVMALEGVIGSEDEDADADGSLYAQLSHAEAEVARLTGVIGSATDSDSLRGMLADAEADVTSLTTQLATANQNLRLAIGTQGTARTEIARLQRLLDTANQKVTTLEATVTRLTAGTTTTTPTDTTGTTPTTPTTPSGGIQDDRRAQAIFTALDNPYTSDARVSVVVPSRNTMRLQASGYTVGGGPAATGFRTARLTDTDPGLKHKIVALTDREISRAMLDHYADSKASGQALEFDVVDAELLTTGTITGTILITTPENIASSTTVKITHGLRKPADPTGGSPGDLIDVDGNPKANFSGSLYGIGGTFHCGANCMVTVDGQYYRSDHETASNRNKLANLVVDVPSGEMLYFKPRNSSALVYLGPDGITGTGVVGDDDNAYMLFGYWIDEPDSVSAPHDVGVFANVIPTTATWGSTVSGTYSGPAVGVYAEKRASGDTHGEFTATATLTGDGTNVGGSVTGFRTTGNSTTSGNWHVTLSEVGVSSGTVSDGDVNIVGFAGTMTTDASSWEATFLANHANSRHNADGGDTERPLSAVGRFNAEIENVLHLVGAFGVHHPGGIAK